MPASQVRLICRYFVASTITVSTDHRLVVAELCFRPRIQKAQAKPPLLNKRSRLSPDVKVAFQVEISNIIGNGDPAQLSSEDLSNLIRSAPVTAAKKVLPQIAKSEFPQEFSAETIALIAQKRASWKLLQTSGQRVTRSNRDAHRTLCKDVKRAVAADRNRKPTTAIMPPEAEFINHYRAHYQPGPEQPLQIAGCELPTSVSDDLLTQADFESGVKSLNENRELGLDECAPEYIKHGGALLWQ